MWSHFKLIQIGASIDGFGKVFEYQRAPAKWKHVHSNLKKINDNLDIKLSGWFAFTVTVFNIFHFPEFMKWKIESGELNRFNGLESRRPIVTHHMCHTPKHYNVKVLPEQTKKEIVEHYKKYKDWVEHSSYSDHVKHHFVKILSGVEKFMLSEDYSKEWLDHFVSKTNKLDVIRDQNIIDVVPEFKQLFEKNKE